MDREVIEQKLESLRRCLTRVGEKCPETPGALATNPDAQDIVALNLTRAVQLCVDIGAHLIAGKEIPPPETMGYTFDALADLGYITPALAVVDNAERVNQQLGHDVNLTAANDSGAE